MHPATLEREIARESYPPKEPTIQDLYNLKLRLEGELEVVSKRLLSLMNAEVARERAKNKRR